MRQEQPNASAARNLGAVNARGEVLLSLDDDISVYPGLLQAHKSGYGDPEVVGVVRAVLHKRRLELTEDKHAQWSYDADIAYIYFQPERNKRRRCFGGHSCNLSVLTRGYLEAGADRSGSRAEGS